MLGPRIVLSPLHIRYVHTYHSIVIISNFFIITACIHDFSFALYCSNQRLAYRGCDYYLIFFFLVTVSVVYKPECHFGNCIHCVEVPESLSREMHHRRDIALRTRKSASWEINISICRAAALLSIPSTTTIIASLRMLFATVLRRVYICISLIVHSPQARFAQTGHSVQKDRDSDWKVLRRTSPECQRDGRPL